MILSSLEKCCYGESIAVMLYMHTSVTNMTIYGGEFVYVYTG